MSSSSITSSSSSALRLTGMATGLDTDSTVKQLMTAYQTRLDKMKQDQQIVSWRQEMYRDILSSISTFKSTYFDVLKSDSYMLSENSFSGYDISVKSAKADTESGVTVTANTGAVKGTYKVKVIQLAETAKLESKAINTSGEVTLANWEGKKISFSIGTDTTSINIGSGFTGGIESSVETDTTLIKDIQSKIDADTKLSGKLSVSVETDTAGKKYIKFNALTDSAIKIVDTSVSDPSTFVSDLSGIVGKVINPERSSTKLTDIGVSSGSKSFTLQYKDSTGTTQTKTITVDNPSTTTIQALSDKISTATSSNVSLKYSELTGKFTLETLNTGSSTILNTTDTDGLFASLGMTVTNKTGVDSIAEITPPNGTATTVKKSSNSFSIDNITYNLTKVAEDATDINIVNINADVQKPYDKIKAFVDKYNEMIDSIYDKIDEKKQYTYLPLTDEEKESMTEDQITKWETKAKQGLLRNDSMLQNMLYNMRSAIFQSVEGAGITLSQVGLSTSSEISDKGKIIIDETKLKDALLNRGEQVAALFSKNSTTYSTYNPDYTQSQRSTRNKEEGIFERIQDILLDYTRTNRDSSGNKGLLIEKAGIVGYSEYTNLLTKDIEDRQTRIDAYIERMNDIEDRYYKQFTNLETAMNKLNSQSSWLSQQLG